METGEATAKNYVKLSQYHMKAGRLESGLYYLEVSLSLDPNLLIAWTSMAKCHMMLGHWTDAMKVIIVLYGWKSESVHVCLFEWTPF